MTNTLDSLSLPAKAMLEFIVRVQRQLKTAASYSLVAHLDQPIAKLTITRHGEVCTICQLDYQTALTSLMELIEARKISIDEIGQRTWRFHCISEVGYRSQ